MVNLNKNVVAHWAAEAAAVFGSNQAPMEMVVQYIREAEGVISPPPAGKFKNKINKIN